MSDTYLNSLFSSELTESILRHDAKMTLEIVCRLKAIGAKRSVVVFGTGHSSLAYRKRFVVDKLKTIAEGVETRELADLLRLFHCDEVQGYWFARPMPADALEAFVRERANALAGKRPLR